MKRTKDIADCIDYRKKKGVAQKIIKDAKRNSWKSYFGSLNEKSKMGEIWKTTKKMNGVRSQHNIPNMNKNNSIYETNSDKAALFVKTFAQVSSDENFSPEFITNLENFQPAYPTETTENQQNADAKSLGDEFQYHELKQAIQQCKRRWGQYFLRNSKRNPKGRPDGTATFLQLVMEKRRATGRLEACNYQTHFEANQAEQWSIILSANIPHFNTL